MYICVASLFKKLFPQTFSHFIFTVGLDVVNISSILILLLLKLGLEGPVNCLGSCGCWGLELRGEVRALLRGLVPVTPLSFLH